MGKIGDHDGGLWIAIRKAKQYIEGE